MLIPILIAVAALVAVLLVVVALRPSQFRIARSATIAAPAEEVFAQVNDFHNWEAWSPYDKLDPAMRKTYSGAPSGEGAVYAWSGNNRCGEGRAEIAESRPEELIRIRLQFIRPFAAEHTAEFTFDPLGEERTTVTWALIGTNSFMCKAMGLFMNMDKMCGGQFEEGLKKLKSVVENAPAFSSRV